MGLYIPPAFAGTDPAAVHALLDAYPFACLVTATPDGSCITHLPLLRKADVLWGHLAAANPHAQALQQYPSVAVFTGPHAYVSPRWYQNPKVEVPTWNYAAVHVSGQAVAMTSAADTLAVLDATVAAFEPADAGWTRDLPPAREAALLRGLLAFALPLSKVEAKFKLSQNKPEADQAGVRDALAAGDALSAAVADLMKNHVR